MTRRKRAFEREMIFFAWRNGIKFHNFEAEQIGQIARKTGIRRDVMFIDQSGVEGAHERAAILNVKFQPVGFPR